MDGNRRWATERGLPTLDGHTRGLERFIESVGWVRECGIPHAVYYAFSTENWRRSQEEVAYLLHLFSTNIHVLLGNLDAHKVRWRVIGRREDFPADLVAVVEELEQASKHYTETTVWIGLSYGGRAEIVTAVNAAIKKGELVDETSFAQYLWTTTMPDPDLIIRTGGEQRLSNFLPWQGVYSELCFTTTEWPAFTKAEFLRMLEAYAKRTRRIGS